MNATLMQVVEEVSTWQIGMRLMFAIILGSTVGFERAMRDKPAGFRTNILICVGSCVFAIASQTLIGDDTDRTRIAAQIVSGVGFLGAGAIIRDSRGIVGLTTAATIWVMAAIGMSVGFGQYALAILGTAGVLVVLLGIPALGGILGEHRELEEYRIVAQKSQDQIDRVELMFQDATLKITLKDYFERGGKIIFNIKALGAQSAHEALRKKILLLDDLQLTEPKRDG